ncbi:MAG: PqqD family protein [Theionarchaea archaeon]|nr:MAG: hypothetical protein AYK19_06385 [Theionarchaea archaeon DG-70-1]MBU7027977.1 PqqD family protein [Theionarchaea archaeon]
MRLLCVKTGDKVLRVRKEEFGCIIFDRNVYVEGNESVYMVLELLAEEKTPQEIIEILAERENVPAEEMREDVWSILKMFNELGWFCEYEEGE